MKYDNTYPIHISLILEKAELICWSNKTMEYNTITYWIDKSWFFILNQILKNEIYFSNTWLIEQTVIDNFFNNIFIKKNSRLISCAIYYSYYSKIRTMLISNITNNCIASIDSIFKNANWLEREVSEMYGVNILLKSDSRKLLLDYSKIEHPMLKDFPSEGVKDVFFDILDNQVVYVNNETTEL